MSENQYSIKDLEHFTQIKSHTIRIWEQRYKLLQPSRTEGNHRYYSESELKKILNVNLLYTNGVKISKIAQMSEAEIVEQCRALILHKSTKDGMINEMIQYIIHFDRSGVERLLDEALRQSDMGELYVTQILPMLQKMGELWQVSTINIIHEHFFSYKLREKLITIISQLPDPQADAPSALLFLHDQEEHEFSLLMYYYFLKKKGFSCIYLGQKVPFQEVLNVYERIQPVHVVSTFTTKISAEELQRILDGLVQIANHAKVMISGAQLLKMEIVVPTSIQHIRGVDELEEIL